MQKDYYKLDSARSVFGLRSRAITAGLSGDKIKIVDLGANDGSMLQEAKKYLNSEEFKGIAVDLGNMLPEGSDLIQITADLRTDEGWEEVFKQEFNTTFMLNIMHHLLPRLGFEKANGLLKKLAERGPVYFDMGSWADSPERGWCGWLRQNSKDDDHIAELLFKDLQADRLISYPSQENTLRRLYRLTIPKREFPYKVLGTYRRNVASVDKKLIPVSGPGDKVEEMGANPGQLHPWVIFRHLQLRNQQMWAKQFLMGSIGEDSPSYRALGVEFDIYQQLLRAGAPVLETQLHPKYGLLTPYSAELFSGVPIHWRDKHKLTESDRKAVAPWADFPIEFRGYKIPLSTLTDFQVFDGKMLDFETIPSVVQNLK